MRPLSLPPLAFTLIAAASLTTAGCSGPHPAPSANTGASHSATSSTTTLPPPQPTTALTPTRPSTYLAATASGATVAVYDHPNGQLLERLPNPIPGGTPLTFLVAADLGTWLKVDLAQRPNGSTGWVKATTLTLHQLPYRLAVSTKTNTLTLIKGTTVVRTFSVATGTGGTPTPHGSFYLTELLAPTNRGYGPYAFGLSAFSTALSSFGGGPGQIGLHGTDDAGSIGKPASHGCIRLRNDDITTLAKLLPLGTPITIE